MHSSVLSIIISKYSFLAVCFILFLPAFYYHPNMGGEGLFVPLSSLVWMVMVLVIVITVWIIIKHQSIRLPPYFNFILAMPLLIVLTGFIVGLEQPLSWMLRVSAILLGFLLFFGLFQFNTSRRKVQNVLYLLSGVFALHAVVGIVQLSSGTQLYGLIPNVGNHIPIGMFQQPNLQASLMATAIGLSVYLVSAPDFRMRTLWLQLLPLVCLFLSAFVLMSSGSRVGLLSGISAIVLMLASRFNLLKRLKGWTVSMLCVLLVGSGTGLIANDGVLRAYSKMEQLSEQGQDIRKDVYRISWEVIKDKPLLGHGIGSFERVFHEKAAEYQLQTKGFNLGLKFSHPHNEFLLWGIEAGVVGLLGFLFAIIAVVLQLFRLGWQRGGAMTALLLPIVLHTQVELPFYLSAYHWMIFLFLLFVVFESGCKTYALNLSLSAGRLIKGFSVMLAAFVFWFCGTSFIYSYQMAYIYYSGKAKVTELNSISQHPYFFDAATRLMLAHYAQVEQRSQGTMATLNFVHWMESYLKYKPDISVFVDLIRAYAYLGDTVSMQATIDRALYLYRNQPLILKAAKEARGK